MPLVKDLPDYKPHTLRLMFKCSTCKAVCPVAAVEISFSIETTNRAMGYTHKTRFYNLVDAPSSWEPRGASERGYALAQLTMNRCGACSRHHGDRDPTTWKTTYITSNVMTCKTDPDHKCDPRCTGAKGPNCSCACGGANHGAGHRALFT